MILQGYYFQGFIWFHGRNCVLSLGFLIQVRLVELHCDAALDMDLTVMKDVPQRDVGDYVLCERSNKNCDDTVWIRVKHHDNINDTVGTGGLVAVRNCSRGSR